MSVSVNKTDSIPKTAIKAGIGATAGCAIGSAVKNLQPVAKKAYDGYISGQQAIIDEIKTKPNVGKYFENIYKMIDKITAKGADGVYETLGSFKAKGNITGEKQINNLVSKLFKKGKTATVEEIKEAEKSFSRNLENPLPSRITAVKKSAKAVFDKIVDKFGNAAENLKKFKDSPSKAEWLKEHKDQIKNTAKKYAPAILIATAAGTAAVLVKRAIAKHKAEKEA